MPSTRSDAGSRAAAGRVLPLADAIGSLARAGGVPFAELLVHGSLNVEIFAPQDVDRQQPHSRDELYVVVKGRGDFVHGDRRDRVRSGDLIFVPARLPHRFENIADGLTVWVMFYGPEGGEAP